ncbi:MAG: hypothetical protein AB4050_10345 [Synechococcus sp.]
MVTAFALLQLYPFAQPTYGLGRRSLHPAANRHHQVVAQASDSQSDAPPNILVLWGDDIGQSNVSAYTRGMMGYQTPN